jgi:inhibitor of KinA
MLYHPPRYRVMGDRSLLVELGDHIGLDVNTRVRELAAALELNPPEGLVDVVPAYASLLLIFDPLRIDLRTLQKEIAHTLVTLDPSRLPEPKILEIPVVYGNEYGPDLEWVARYHHLTPREVVSHHTAHVYHVYMIGFIPGFPYMGELPKILVTPRRETPRTQVPKGSVGLAQAQTGIYPNPSPGGWQIIGRTPVKLFDALKTPPALLEMGDRVRFYAIEEEEWERWAS